MTVVRYPSRILIPLFILLMVTSCSKEEDPEPEPSASMTAKVDGTNWNASSIEASVVNGFVTLIGKSGDQRVISLSLAGDSAGTYNLDNTTASSGNFASSGTASFFSSGASNQSGGEAKISSINFGDNTMSGSFYFMAGRVTDDSLIDITSGSFSNIPFSDTPIGGSLNTFRVNIDGSPWVSNNVQGFIAFQALNVSATGADGQQSVSFTMPEDIAPGEYELAYFTPIYASYVTSDGKQMFSTSGKLKITEHHLATNKLSAEFSMTAEEFTGNGSAQFSNGLFDVTYTK